MKTLYPKYSRLAELVSNHSMIFIFFKEKQRKDKIKINLSCILNSYVNGLSCKRLKMKSFGFYFLFDRRSNKCNIILLLWL